jgi:hypothetical protein
MRDVYLATAPEVYIPVFVVFLIGAFRKSIFLVLLSVLLFAAAASIFIGPPAAADDAAPAADAILAPATGTVTTLDCLRPLGYARIKIASKKTDTYARLAPMDGLLTEIEPGPATESAESAERLFQLDTATGRFTMTFSAARPSHIVPLLQTARGAIAVHRGDPIAVVKWGGETTVEFPLRNVHIATDLGAQVQAGGAMGHIQAVWV